jgi:hypothetical protein
VPRSQIFLLRLLCILTDKTAQLCLLACTGEYQIINSFPYEGSADSINSTTPALEVQCQNLAPASRGRWYYISRTTLSGYNRVYFDTCTSNTDVDIVIQIYSSPVAGCSPQPSCVGGVYDGVATLCEGGSFTVDSTQHYWVRATGQVTPFSFLIISLLFSTFQDLCDDIRLRVWSLLSSRRPAADSSTVRGRYNDLCGRL